MKTQNFIIIMSAGRCGSTSLLNFLNRSSNFHIYGENCGFILSLTNAIKQISELINHHRNIKYDSYNKYQNNQKYLTNAFFYDNKSNLEDIKLNLLEQIQKFFPTNKQYIGFKEIRWLTGNIHSLNILETLYNNIYIHLTRNIDDQCSSLKKTFLNYKSKEEIEHHIEQTNKCIQDFLQTKDKKISINISENENFLQDIEQSILVYRDTGEEWLKNLYDK